MLTFNKSELHVRLYGDIYFCLEGVWDHFLQYRFEVEIEVQVEVGVEVEVEVELQVEVSV